MRSVIIVMILFLTGCTSQQVTNNAQVEFKNKEVDMHILKYKVPASCSFQLKNSGKQPLVILDIKTSCGCTVPNWKKKPIKPGKEDKITIKYDTSHPGRFRKTITVYYNGPASPAELVVKGEVEFPENIDE